MENITLIFIFGNKVLFNKLKKSHEYDPVMQDVRDIVPPFEFHIVVNLFT